MSMAQSPGKNPNGESNSYEVECGRSEVTSLCNNTFALKRFDFYVGRFSPSKATRNRTSAFAFRQIKQEAWTFEEEFFNAAPSLPKLPGGAAHFDGVRDVREFYACYP